MHPLSMQAQYDCTFNRRRPTYGENMDMLGYIHEDGVHTERDVHKEGTDTEGTDTGQPEPRAAKLLPISMHFCRTYF